MTRKKSNVKALALAVTCAILAGGYSGLNPVYAGDATGTITDITATADLSTGTVTATGGTITVSGSEIAGALSGEDISSAKVDGSTLKEKFDGLSGDLTTQKNNYTQIASVLNVNDKTLTGMTSVSSETIEAKNTLKVGSKEITESTITGYDAAVVNTGGITRDQKGFGLSYDRTIIEGLSIARDEYTVGLYTGDWNESVGAKNAAIKISRGSDNISEVTIPRLYVSEIKDSSSPSTEPITFADIKGAVKATDKISYDDTNGTVVDGKLSLKNSDGSYSSVNDTVENTKNISIVQDKYVTSSDATKIDGITVAGGVRLADGNVRGKSLVLEGVVASGNPPQATLTYDRLSAFTGLLVENGNEPAERDNDNKTVIDAGDGSKIGGVTFTNKSSDPNQKYVDVNNVGSINEDQIKFGQDAGFHDTTTINKTMEISERFGSDSYGSVKINEGRDNQVIIGEEGIVVGKNSTVIGSDGVYAGGHTEATAKAVLNADGSIKGAGDGAGNYKFSVDGATGAVTAAGGYKIDANNEWTSDNLKVGDGTNGVTLAGGNVTATGKLQGKTIAAGANGTEFTVDENGDVVAKGTLSAADGKFSVDTNGKATAKGGLSVGDADQFSVDAATGNVVSKGTITANNGASIGGVTFDSAGNITNVSSLTTNALTVTGAFTTGGNMTVTGNLTVNGQVTAANGGSIGGVNLSGDKVTASTGSIGDVNFAAGVVTGVNDITATKGTIGNVSLESGKVAAATLTDGTAILSGGVLTGLLSANIGGNTTIDSTGIQTNKVTVGTGANATTIDEANGIVSGKGEIGAVKFTGIGKLENVTAIDGVSVAQNSGSAAGGLTFGGNATIGATGIPFQSTGFKVDDDGDVTGKSFVTANGTTKLEDNQLTIGAGNSWTQDAGITASNVKVGSNELKNDGLYVGTNTTVKDGELTVGAGNTWSMANGITASKAGINGVTIGETEGKATFNNAGKTTTIDGDTIKTGTITADELLIDKISLGKDGSSNISIDKDGNVVSKGEIKIIDTAGNVMSKLSQDSAAFGQNGENQTNITNGRINAKAKDNANQQAEFNFDENGLTVSGQNAEGKTSSFGFNAQIGAGTFTGLDSTTTTISGSSITSKISDADNSVLNGGKLDVTKNGKTTTIEGGVITTDTLKVNDIILGGNLYDADGKPLDGKLSIGNDGHLRAANGNFDVTADGSFKNTVGDTTLETTSDKATISNGNASIEVKNGNITDKVGNTTVETKDGSFSVKDNTSGKGMDINTATGDVTFTGNNSHHGGGSQETTVINGNEITTGKITTDQLIIKGNGQGEAAGAGSGSIALAGDGSLKSDINDGRNHTTFETSNTGTTTTVSDGTYNATNEVTAKKIGSVITGGSVEISQELNAETGKITNKTGDTSTELGNDGFAVKQNGYNDVNIANGDVSVTNKNTGKQVNLSDLGTLGDLNEEITSRDEYKQNSTAVGAINSVSGRLTDEVNRLDGRINDVSDRVNKVGAMAAAIASLKTMGYDPQAPSEFSVGLGHYKGETGVALGFFHYPNKNFMINVSLSTAGGETMGGIGATWRFGHKSPQKLLDEQRAAQAKKELAAAEKYQAAAKLAKEAQERAEYAAKLARQAQVSADNAKAAADATQAKHF